MTFHEELIEKLARRMHDGVRDLLQARHPKVKLEWVWDALHEAHKEKWRVIAEWHCNEMLSSEGCELTALIAERDRLRAQLSEQTVPRGT
jgi:hypothetical protein